MATKVKPIRLQISGTPQAGDVPQYVDNDNFQWWSWSSITVVDALNSTSATDALSANQWKVLNDKISDLFWLGKFLSLWNATTWLPTSFPLQTPYTYSTWDYYLVSVVSSANPPVNYRPTWSSYSGTASSTIESDELEVWDVYIYDWSTWLLQSNHWKTVSFSNIAWDAMDNVSLSWYLNMKAFYLSSTSDLTTAQAAYNWQNWWKTAVIIYNNKPYVCYWGNAAAMDFWSMFYREQSSNTKTDLVRDVVILSLSGDTVTSISANSWNNIIASVLKTDTDYATPYTPQYNGSPATKKYVDDRTFTWNNWWVKVFSDDDPISSWNVSSALAWRNAWWQAIFRRSFLLGWVQWDAVYYVSYWDPDNRIIHLISFTDGYWADPEKHVVTYNASGNVTNVTTTTLGGWIQEAPNSPITWIKYVWRGSEAQYAALSQYYTDVPWDTKFETY